MNNEPSCGASPSNDGLGHAPEPGLLARLHSLKVLLGTDSPEVRGWAPVVQQGAQATVNAAIAEVKASDDEHRELMNAYHQACVDAANRANEIDRLKADNAALAAELRGAHTLFACLCRDSTASNWADRAEALLTRLKA